MFFVKNHLSKSCIKRKKWKHVTKIRKTRKTTHKNERKSTKKEGRKQDYDERE